MMQDVENKENHNRFKLYSAEWFSDIFKLFQDNLNQKTLPHAILLNGPKGCGKFEFAKYKLARKILGINSKQLALFDSEMGHPDCYIISPEGARSEIKIESIRQLQKSLSQTAQQSSGQRVVIIQGAECLNLSSANSLLKTLEEPQSNITLILTADESKSLLSTIYSRCVVYKIKPNLNQIQNYFSNYLNSNIKTIPALIKLFGLNIIEIQNKLDNTESLDQFLSILSQCIPGSRHFNLNHNPLKLSQVWQSNKSDKSDKSDKSGKSIDFMMVLNGLIIILTELSLINQSNNNLNININSYLIPVLNLISERIDSSVLEHQDSLNNLNFYKLKQGLDQLLELKSDYLKQPSLNLSLCWDRLLISLFRALR